jgi:hypothetical protein
MTLIRVLFFSPIHAKKVSMVAKPLLHHQYCILVVQSHHRSFNTLLSKRGLIFFERRLRLKIYCLNKGNVGGRKTATIWRGYRRDYIEPTTHRNAQEQNRTPGCRVRDGDVSHYTISEGIALLTLFWPLQLPYRSIVRFFLDKIPCVYHFLHAQSEEAGSRPYISWYTQGILSKKNLTILR